jgi:hypothetical protein
MNTWLSSKCSCGLNIDWQIKCRKVGAAEPAAALVLKETLVLIREE